MLVPGMWTKYRGSQGKEMFGLGLGWLSVGDRENDHEGEEDELLPRQQSDKSNLSHAKKITCISILGKSFPSSHEDEGGMEENLQDSVPIVLQ